jgi:hypothetical protein
MNFLPRTLASIVWDFNDPVKLTVLHDDITDLIVSGTYIGYFSECWVTDEDYVTKIYGAEFDDLTVTGSVSIAGVSFEGLFFLEGYVGDAAVAPYAFYTADGTLTTLVQTAGDATHYLGAAAAATKTGAGWRFKASGSAGGINITSYTYFSLTETFATSTCGQSLAKSGTYTVDGCIVGFTEQYIYIDGFTFGCAENIAIGLDITCAGFQWIAFEVDNLDLGLCCSGITADFQIKFGERSKTVALCFGFEAKETTCFEFAVSLDYSGYSLTGFTIDSVSLEHTWNGITFSSETLFGSYSSTITDAANQILFMVPNTGMKDGALATSLLIASVDDEGIGYYDTACVYTEKYEVWESFTVASEGDSCCGGAFTFSVTTSFGTKFELDAWAYDYQFDNAAGNVHISGLYDATEITDPAPTVASVTGGTDLNGDGAVDLIDYTTVVGAVSKEQLLTGTVYDEATSDQLFQWVSTDIDLSIGLGSAWSLTFGLNIDVYGWNSLAFGFEFAF